MASDARIAEAEAAFAGNYIAYQYHAVEFVVGHLADLSKQFRGDLQQMLVLAIIGQMELHHRLTHADPDAASRPSIGASRIADVTGIPRQTVRRKLASLSERGWIEADGAALWRLKIVDASALARTDLSEVDRRKMRRLAELYASLETIIHGA
jgi:DNA-binding MarR family transcriptional regulator